MQATRYCECGCGQAVKNRFAWGHSRRHTGLALSERIAKEDRGFAGECEIWTGALSSGYATTYAPGTRRTIYVHRWRYERANGPIPDGLQLDHLCCNRACVNPDHLEIVTPAENTRRGKVAKLTIADVAQIRHLASSHSQKYLADHYGVNPSQISKILSGKVWRPDNPREHAA